MRGDARSVPGRSAVLWTIWTLAFVPLAAYGLVAGGRSLLVALPVAGLFGFIFGRAAIDLVLTRLDARRGRREESVAGR